MVRRMRSKDFMDFSGDHMRRHAGRLDTIRFQTRGKHAQSWIAQTGQSADVSTAWRRPGIRWIRPHSGRGGAHAATGPLGLPVLLALLVLSSGPAAADL